jgi:hypothetical protein
VQIYVPHMPPHDDTDKRNARNAAAAAAKAQRAATDAAAAAERSASAAVAALQGRTSVVPEPRAAAEQLTGGLGGALYPPPSKSAGGASVLPCSVAAETMAGASADKEEENESTAAAAPSTNAAASAASDGGVARDQGSRTSLDVDVFRDGAAVGDVELIAQLRGQMMHDLRFDDRVYLLRETRASAPKRADEVSSGIDAKRDALSALLTMRSHQIEATQREKCTHASRQLITAYQQQVARLQAALIRQLSELGATAQRNVESEVQAFMQLGLPAIQHILSDHSSLAAKVEDADAHAHAAAATAAFASATDTEPLSRVDIPTNVAWEISA